MRQAGVICETRSLSDISECILDLQWVVDAKGSATRSLCGGVILNSTSISTDNTVHIGPRRADIKCIRLDICGKGPSSSGRMRQRATPHRQPNGRTRVELGSRRRCNPEPSKREDCQRYSLWHLGKGAAPSRVGSRRTELLSRFDRSCRDPVGQRCDFRHRLVVCPAKNVPSGGSGERAACRGEGRAHDDRRGADMFLVSLVRLGRGAVRCRSAVPLSAGRPSDFLVRRECVEGQAHSSWRTTTGLSLAGTDPMKGFVVPSRIRAAV
jgi:hypothetical protein